MAVLLSKQGLIFFRRPPFGPRAALCWLCALLSSACLLDETNKDRCRSQADCFAGNTCLAGRCQDAATKLDGGENLDCSFGGCPDLDEACNVDRCMQRARSGDFFVCSDDAPCPTEQQCNNGLCSAACVDDFDCTLSEFCDQAFTHRCLPQTVASCSETACEVTQSCVQGLCAQSVEASACRVSPGQDLCPAGSQCIDFAAGPAQDLRCVSRPPCMQDGSCPTGTQGAICNIDLFADLGRICLSGRCQQGEHCPEGEAWSCVIFLGQALGYCSDGALGAPCTMANQCQSRRCTPVAEEGGEGYCDPA